MHSKTLCVLLTFSLLCYHHGIIFSFNKKSMSFLSEYLKLCESFLIVLICCVVVVCRSLLFEEDWVRFFVNRTCILRVYSRVKKLCIFNLALVPHLNYMTRRLVLLWLHLVWSVDILNYDDDEIYAPSWTVDFFHTTPYRCSFKTSVFLLLINKSSQSLMVSYAVLGNVIM